MSRDSIWKDFRPLTLAEVAKALGTQPFEVMRLLVAAGNVPPILLFSPEQVDRLRVMLGKS
jgi:hypothetical protein